MATPHHLDSHQQMAYQAHGYHFPARAFAESEAAPLDYGASATHAEALARKKVNLTGATLVVDGGFTA